MQILGLGLGVGFRIRISVSAPLQAMVHCVGFPV